MTLFSLHIAGTEFLAHANNFFLSRATLNFLRFGFSFSIGDVLLNFRFILFLRVRQALQIHI